MEEGERRRPQGRGGRGLGLYLIRRSDSNRWRYRYCSPLNSKSCDGANGFIHCPLYQRRRLETRRIISHTSTMQTVMENVASAVNESGSAGQKRIEVHAYPAFFHFRQQRRLVTQRGCQGQEVCACTVPLVETNAS